MFEINDRVKIIKADGDEALVGRIGVIDGPKDDDIGWPVNLVSTYEATDGSWNHMWFKENELEKV